MLNYILLDISNGWKTAIMMVAMGLVFYFFLLRPQQQTAKKEQAYRDGLKSGDRVMTSGGIHGTVTGTDRQYAFVQVASGVTLRVLKTGLQPIPEPKRK
ncbi:MAG: preprotein translocase subunit YajC [Bacteroidales bacterium]|nr:preprotein translocase subunit YajC [Bacteroidales bacterium]